MRAEAGLTQRETQIAELLAWGAAKKEVADRLSISPRTVENTARNIYSKIGIQKAICSRKTAGIRIRFLGTIKGKGYEATN